MRDQQVSPVITRRSFALYLPLTLVLTNVSKTLTNRASLCAQRFKKSNGKARPRLTERETVAAQRSGSAPRLAMPHPPASKLAPTPPAALQEGGAVTE